LSPIYGKRTRDITSEREREIEEKGDRQGG